MSEEELSIGSHKRGWVEIQVICHGDYFRDINCCPKKKIICYKRKNVGSLNSQENYFRCEGCGQEFMTKEQEFICVHNERRKQHDLVTTIFVKKGGKR
jgi:hypothetical protein